MISRRLQAPQSQYRRKFYAAAGRFGAAALGYRALAPGDGMRLHLEMSVTPGSTYIHYCLNQFSNRRRIRSDFRYPR
jgi:hypothetical protein